MVLQDTTRTGMPLAEFLRLSTQEGEFELIDGERIAKLPTVAGHSYATRETFLAVHVFAKANQLGEAFSETTFILPDAYDSDWVKGSRIPDVMFIPAETLAAYRSQAQNWSERPYPIVPSLTVEVVSPTDSYSDVDAKVDLYRADGVPLIWVVDPQRRKVAVYENGSEQPTFYHPGGILSGGEVLPGFTLPVSDIFPK
jgi:Uma2 family endonuclease